MDIEDRPAPTPFAPADEAKVVVYRGGAVFDGTGSGLRSDAAIVVAGGNIRAVLDNAELSAELLDGAEVVELDGRVVIPGLIDSHQHLATPPNRPVAEATLRRHVYSGVTAIRDMADDLRHIADLTRSTRVGEIAGPDIHYAALMAEASSTTRARGRCRKARRRGTSPGCRRSPKTPTCGSRSRSRAARMPAP
jgi:imidazolonepropionase-like amidohydrolase